MNVKQLYKKYQIMPQLETHMLRVAAVGKIVADNWIGTCDSLLTTQLCLLHDMGNIVKFDLSDNLDRAKFGNIEKLPYWQGIQKEHIEKFGKSAHDATNAILRDAKLTQFIPLVIEEESLYFAEAKEAELEMATVASIILLYSDCRVTPGGVVSYRERVNDLQSRYGAKTQTWYDWTYWFEGWMQSKVKIDLNSITDQTVEPLFDELLTYTI